MFQHTQQVWAITLPYFQKIYIVLSTFQGSDPKNNHDGASLMLRTQKLISTLLKVPSFFSALFTDKAFQRKLWCLCYGTPLLMFSSQQNDPNSLHITSSILSIVPVVLIFISVRVQAQAEKRLLQTKAGTRVGTVLGDEDDDNVVLSDDEEDYVEPNRPKRQALIDSDDEF